MSTERSHVASRSQPSSDSFSNSSLPPKADAGTLDDAFARYSVSNDQHEMIPSFAQALGPAVIIADLQSQLEKCADECSDYKRIYFDVALLSETADESALPVLTPAHWHGVYTASILIEKILGRRMNAGLAAQACAPPTPTQIEAAREALEGFAVFEWERDSLKARMPTKTEQGDLAYFMAATAENGMEILGGDRTRWIHGKPCDETQIQALEQLDADASRLVGEAVKQRRLDAYRQAVDMYAEERAAMSRYTGTCDARRRTFDRIWLRELALGLEIRGRYAEAEQLNRRMAPDTEHEYDPAFSEINWQFQVRAVVRTGELAGGCRTVAAERLIAIDGVSTYPREIDMGPTRLAAAGFDLARLYRGAFVTRNRDMLPAQLDDAVLKLPKSKRVAVRERFDRLGPEDWERRVFALEGLADTVGRPAIDVLAAALPRLHPVLRKRCIRALGSLAFRLTVGPCTRVESMGAGYSSGPWHRAVRSVGLSCPNRMSDEDADHLAALILPFLEDADGETRRITVEALERISADISLSPLKHVADTDPETEGCDEGPCRYPVRQVAKEAALAIENRFQAVQSRD